jgi:hypothetical protein
MLGNMAVIAALLSFGSGLLVVGDGRHWNYSPADLRRLRYDAVVYSALTFSTIWSIFHAALLSDYVGSDRPAAISGAHFAAWMILHSSISLFLIAFHAYVAWAVRDPAASRRMKGFPRWSQNVA